MSIEGKMDYFRLCKILLGGGKPHADMFKEHFRNLSAKGRLNFQEQKLPEQEKSGDAAVDQITPLKEQNIYPVVQFNEEK